MNQMSELTGDLAISAEQIVCMEEHNVCGPPNDPWN